MNDLFTQFEQANEVVADDMKLSELNALISEYREIRLDYEAKKEIATEAYNRRRDMETKLIGTLDAIGRKSFEVEGVAKITKVAKMTYRIAEGLENKRQLCEYIELKYGRETLENMLSINSNTLKSWAVKEAELTGVVAIPGLEMPVPEISLSFSNKGER